MLHPVPVPLSASPVGHLSTRGVQYPNRRVAAEAPVGCSVGQLLRARGLHHLVWLVALQAPDACTGGSEGAPGLPVETDAPLASTSLAYSGVASEGQQLRQPLEDHCCVWRLRAHLLPEKLGPWGHPQQSRTASSTKRSAAFQHSGLRSFPALPADRSQGLNVRLYYLQGKCSTIEPWTFPKSIRDVMAPHSGKNLPSMSIS